MPKFGPGAAASAMPNPQASIPAIAGAAAPAAAAAQPAASGGFFGQPMTKQRYDMAMQMLSAAMSSAGRSGSPLAAFLAPIAGAAIGRGVMQKRDSAAAEDAAGMTDALLGPAGMSPEARQALAVLQNENAPDYLRAIAKTRLDQAMKQPTRSTSTRSNGSARAPAKANDILYGEYVLDGKYYGRTRDGRMVPYKDDAGNPVSVPGKTAKTPAPASPASAPPAAPTLPSMPSLPADPTLMNDDPLGIRK